MADNLEVGCPLIIQEGDMTRSNITAGLVESTYQLEKLKFDGPSTKKEARRQSVDTPSTAYHTKPASPSDIELKVLKQKLKEALETKAKWQSYDRSRDELVNRLESEKRALQAKLAQVRPSDLISSERDDVILYWKRKAEEAESTIKRLEEVNRGQLVYTQNLQRALQESQRSAYGADRERVEILENQVKIFSEDFEQERQDRERAQARVNSLEEQLRLTEAQLRQFQDESMSQLAARRRHTMSTYRAEYDRQLALQSPSTTTSSRLIPHGVYYNPEMDGGFSEEEDEDELEEFPMSHSQSKGPTTLDCPKCHKQFPSSDPMAFLDHNDICSWPVEGRDS